MAELKAHKERSSSEGLVFPNAKGNPMNPLNVRRDIWIPLKKRAGVRTLDPYSLRHTFTSMARTSDENAFNVSRMLGDTRTQLVDDIYAETMESGLASVSESVTSRALGIAKPKLRIIEGGVRDVREPLDNVVSVEEKKSANLLIVWLPGTDYSAFGLTLRVALAGDRRHCVASSNRLFVCRRFELTLLASVYNSASTSHSVPIGSPGRIRTADQRINSPSLYH